MLVHQRVPPLLQQHARPQSWKLLPDFSAETACLTWQISAAASRLSDSIPLLVVMNAKPTDCGGNVKLRRWSCLILTNSKIFQVLQNGVLFWQSPMTEIQRYLVCSKNDRTTSFGANSRGVGIEYTPFITFYHHRTYRSWSILYGGDPLYTKQLSSRAPCFAMVASCAVLFFEVGTPFFSKMTKNATSSSSNNCCHLRVMSTPDETKPWFIN